MGLGAALLAFLNAELRSGIEIVTEAVELKKAIMDADLVITGEGRIDSQSIKGKYRLVSPDWRNGTISRSLASQVV